MPKYYYSSVAAAAKLQGTITDTQTNSIILDTATGLPASFPFKLVIDPSGTLEAIKVNAMSGATITDCVRGVDGTTASAHDVGVDVVHDSTAEDFGDPNDHIYGSQAAGSARHPATAVSVSPTGNVASTDVQAAIAELDSEKAATTHTHAEADVTSLTTDLSAKEVKSSKGVANGYAGLDASAHVPTAQLGSGSASASTYLRGDNTWATLGASLQSASGTYTGDGTSNRSIGLSFSPKIVFVTDETNARFFISNLPGGVVDLLVNVNAVTSGSTPYAILSTNAFLVSNAGNTSGATFRYLAIG